MATRNTRRHKKELPNAAEIKKQMEFYFSDNNLKHDKFLREKLKFSENVELSVLQTFSRLKVLNPSMNIENLALSLKDSKVLVVSEDGKKVKRVVEFKPEELKTCQKYIVSNIPLTATLDELLEYFKKFNPLIVKMQKQAQKFIGKCYLEFSKDENLEEFKDLKYGDQELSIEVPEKKEPKEKAPKRELKSRKKGGNKRQKKEEVEEATEGVAAVEPVEQ